MSLWTEHLGMVDKCFKEAETLDCVKSMNAIAGDNWTSLCTYLSVAVDVNRKVSALPGRESFPDVGGKILRARTTLPEALTT
ncbi:hypothetical protein ACFX2J_042194 [Malus domestica]